MDTLLSPNAAQTALRDAFRLRRIGLNLTQAELAQRSGVPLPSLKRFEQRAEVSLSSLLRLAWAMDALREFGDLFPPVEAATLDDLDRQAKPRQRATGRRG